MSVTIVTAYIQIGGGKHKEAEYGVWMANFLRHVTTPIVIYVNTIELVQQITNELRTGESNQKTVVHLVDMAEAHCTRVCQTTDASFSWAAQHGKDREAYIHNAKLYAVWNEKFAWLARACEEDPFETDYFVWADMGIFRSQFTADVMRRDFGTWPDVSKLQRITDNGRYFAVLQMFPFSRTEEQQSRDAGESRVGPDFSYVNRIGAGVFGGSKPSVRLMCAKYYETLSLYVQEGRFCGKEQNVMASLCLRNAHLLSAITHPRSAITSEERWFYLRNMLRPQQATDIFEASAANVWFYKSNEFPHCAKVHFGHVCVQ